MLSFHADEDEALKPQLARQLRQTPPIELMFLLQNARAQPIFIIIWQHINLGLAKDRAFIDTCGNQMHRAAMLCHAGL